MQHKYTMYNIQHKTYYLQYEAVQRATYVPLKYVLNIIFWPILVFVISYGKNEQNLCKKFILNPFSPEKEG